jgi:hypothetical protein
MVPQYGAFVGAALWRSAFANYWHKCQYKRRALFFNSRVAESQPQATACRGFYSILIDANPLR